jgi:1,4-alpha-glucan branching enzyme
VPLQGYYREAMNSDAELYGGSNVGNRGGVHSEPISWMGRPNSIPIALPPLAGVVMVYEPDFSADADRAGAVASTAGALNASTAPGADPDGGNTPGADSEGGMGGLPA